MEFLRRAQGNPSQIGILSAAFDPPTRAHLALVRSGLKELDEVVLLLPRRFPHKEYGPVGLDDRAALLLRATEGMQRVSVAIAEGGLFIEIARECRATYRSATDLWFLCGRDAAERIVNWDYGEPGAFERQLEEYGLRVADRMGHYAPPSHLAPRILPLKLDGDYDEVSATAVRDAVRAVRAVRPWRHLVPPSIHDEVQRLYSQQLTPGN